MRRARSSAPKSYSSQAAGWRRNGHTAHGGREPSMQRARRDTRDKAQHYGANRAKNHASPKPGTDREECVRVRRTPGEGEIGRKAAGATNIGGFTRARRGWRRGGTRGRQLPVQRGPWCRTSTRHSTMLPYSDRALFSPKALFPKLLLDDLAVSCCWSPCKSCSNAFSLSLSLSRTTY